MAEHDQIPYGNLYFISGRRAAADPEAAATELSTHVEDIVAQQDPPKPKFSSFTQSPNWISFRARQRRFTPALDILEAAGVPGAWDRAIEIVDQTSGPEEATTRANECVRAYRAGNSARWSRGSTRPFAEVTHTRPCTRTIPGQAADHPNSI